MIVESFKKPLYRKGKSHYHNFKQFVHKYFVYDHLELFIEVF